MKTNHHKQNEADKAMDHNPKGEKDKYSDIFEFRPGDDKLLRPLQNVYGKLSDIYRKAGGIATNKEDTSIEPAQDLQPAIEASNIESVSTVQPVNEACNIEQAPTVQPVNEASNIEQTPTVQPVIEASNIEPAPPVQPVIEASNIEPAPIVKPVVEVSNIEQTPPVQPLIEVSNIEQTPTVQPLIEASNIEPAPTVQPLIEACNIEPAPTVQPAIEACTIVSARDLQPAVESYTSASDQSIQPDYLEQKMGQELQQAIPEKSFGQMLEHQAVMKTNADDDGGNLQSISSVMMIESEADEFLQLRQVISSDIENDVITSDKAQTRRLYIKYFPNDKTNNARSYNFMVNKLLKKGLKIANLAS